MRRLLCFTVFMCWCRHFYWSAVWRASLVQPDGTNTRVRSAQISPTETRSHLENTKHEYRSETVSVKMLMRLWTSHTSHLDHYLTRPPGKTARDPTAAVESWGRTGPSPLGRVSHRPRTPRSRGCPPVHKNSDIFSLPNVRNKWWFISMASRITSICLFGAFYFVSIHDHMTSHSFTSSDGVTTYGGLKTSTSTFPFSLGKRHWTCETRQNLWNMTNMRASDCEIWLHLSRACAAADDWQVRGRVFQWQY